MDHRLIEILEQLKAGALTTERAAALVEGMSAEPLGFATVDHARRQRCGAAEVVFAAGKTAAQVVAIVRAIRTRQPAALVTRATAEHRAALIAELQGEAIEAGTRGGTILIGRPQEVAGVPPIPIVTAGTSDEPVAEEAELTCKAMGQPALRVNDVGVAGLHRLGARLTELRQANVVICIAGMEGALPSVVGGLVDIPVIGVPTSVGYGAALGGVTPLLGMLTSCASGVSVVNIDNGFGAAYTACLINRLPVRRG
ncbi:MAG: nickel pincer cofactor biosynthesis protein LarB [Planctomycetota bacterium]|nr:nickel pincer cofactor biosynthesis protein LarB [Planctomycetota bacterium]